MSKQRKSNRPNLPEQTLARARAELYGDQFAEAAPAVAVPVVHQPHHKPRARVVTLDELKTEYAYVINDIRNMFILAGVLIVSLIVISLILL